MTGERGINYFIDKIEGAPRCPHGCDKGASFASCTQSLEIDKWAVFCCRNCGHEWSFCRDVVKDKNE